MGENDRILGEILQSTKDTNGDVKNLGIKIDDISRNGTEVCRQNSKDIEAMQTMLDAQQKMMNKAIAIISAVVGGSFGAGKLIDMFGA